MDTWSLYLTGCCEQLVPLPAVPLPSACPWYSAVHTVQTTPLSARPATLIKRTTVPYLPLSLLMSLSYIRTGEPVLYLATHPHLALTVQKPTVPGSHVPVSLTTQYWVKLWLVYIIYDLLSFCPVDGRKRRVSRFVSS